MSKYTTRQRRALLDYLTEHADESLSAAQIAEALSGQEISVSAVYRNLADMEAEGRLRRVAPGGSREAVYQYIDERECRGCLHLSCTKCGKTVHMQQQTADALVSSVESDSHFSIDKSETVIYGVCSDCKTS